MKIVDDTNWQAEITIGQNITGLQGGFGYQPPPAGYVSPGKPFNSLAPMGKIPRNEWPDRIKEMKSKRMNISACQNWSCDAQSGPTCWAAGTVQAMSTARVIAMGLEHYVRYSANSIAVPISGGNSGGWEAEAVKYAQNHGVVDSDLWPYGSRDRSLDSKPDVQTNRAKHKCLEAYDCRGFDEFATALLLGLPCTVSYNWWSHVVMLTDLVEIESGSFGFLIRNNWGDGYGDKNEYGFGGYAVFREGKGTPGGGLAIRQMMTSVK